MPRGQHRRTRRPGETKAQARRRNIFLCVNEVVNVGEQITSRMMMDRMVIKFGAGFYYLPRNADTLGNMLSHRHDYVKVNVKGKNEWRRIR